MPAQTNKNQEGKQVVKSHHPKALIHKSLLHQDLEILPFPLLCCLQCAHGSAEQSEGDMDTSPALLAHSAGDRIAQVTLRQDSLDQITNQDVSKPL